MPIGPLSPFGVAVTPDGKHAYVTNGTSNNVSVIDTVTNKVVATVTVGSFPFGVGVALDGKHVYVTNAGKFPGTVSVIATATNKVVATVPVGLEPNGVAVTPDGKHVYVANFESFDVSVIDTATNKVVATVPAEHNVPNGIAVTPDGKRVYVPIFEHDVSVIDTATNTVVATVPVSGGLPVDLGGVAIVPPPPGVPFLAFSAALGIVFGGAPNQDSFALQSSFISSSTVPGINPLTEPVTLQAGTFAVTIPPGSFKKTSQGYFIFVGVIDGATVEALIEPTGTLRYALQAKAVRASFTGTKNPVYVTLTIGGDSGVTTVTAHISP